MPEREELRGMRLNLSRRAWRLRDEIGGELRRSVQRPTARTMLRFVDTKRWSSDSARLTAGPALTLLLVGLIEALHLKGLPALPLTLMLTVAFSALLGGLASGVLSGAVALAHTLYYYRSPGFAFRYSSANLERLIIFTVALPLVVATLANLRQRLEDLLIRERHQRLQAERERQRVIDILESITDGFFALDRQWRYTYVNRRAEQLTGRARQELIGQAIWDAFPPLVGSTWDREYHRAVEQQAAVHFDEFYPPLDTWFETHAYPSRDGLTIYLRSINERKHAEDMLRTRARQQAAVAALGQQALGGGDLHTLMDAAVHALASTLRVELAKILELIPEKQELVMRAGVGWKGGIDHRVAAGERSQAGYTLARREPVVVTDLLAETRFQGPRLLLDNGVVSGLSVIIAGRDHPFGILGAHSQRRRTFTEDDVYFLHAVANVLAEAIERARNERALAESELRFRQLAENVREVFYINALHPAQVLYVSPAYETVWGRSCSSLYQDATSWLDAIHPDDRARVESSTGERDGGFFDGEYRVVHPDGAVRWIRDRSSPVLGDDGRATRIVGIAEDVTDLRAAAEAQSRVAASEAAIRARDDVLAVVAHDLRNPLNSIAMTAEMLETMELSADKRAMRARQIKRAVQRADHLIRDLLDAARIESGQFAVEPQPLDIAPVVAEACETFLPLAAEKSIALECIVGESLPRAFGDHDRILQALGNLLGNAIKFTPEGGRVVLRAERFDGGVELSVEDTGAGIDPDALPHVFDRFWRAHPADRRGLGLGLAIVKGIVGAHHGRAWVQSELGRGSAFHFTVPSDPARAA